MENHKNLYNRNKKVSADTSLESRIVWRIYCEHFHVTHISRRRKSVQNHLQSRWCRPWKHHWQHWRWRGVDSLSLLGAALHVEKQQSACDVVRHCQSALASVPQVSPVSSHDVASNWGPQSHRAHDQKTQHEEASLEQNLEDLGQTLSLIEWRQMHRRVSYWG